MTIGVGTSTKEKELRKLKPFETEIPAIATNEYQQRVQHAQQLMRANNIKATYINAGTNLHYFTGINWHPSERMVGAIIPAHGDIQYITPYFEIGTIQSMIIIKGKIHGWQEDDNPYLLFHKIIKNLTHNNYHSTIAIDESSPFFITDGISTLNENINYINAQIITAGCRMYKSLHEIALMQRAKDITLQVQKSTAKILKTGITVTEVKDFIHQAHIKMGAINGSYFCIVLFGEDTAYPHGVKQPKKLEPNDMVLIDTGCKIHHYMSDITRSYVFGEPSQKQRHFWEIEKNAQHQAFLAAQLGNTCSSVDSAARGYLESQNLGPDYQLPGLPHRTGHGIGLDIHEWPYLVNGDDTIISKGMCFSNEPMICIPGSFGIRLEDHFFMTEQGPKWFTKPAYSIDDPFANCS